MKTGKIGTSPMKVVLFSAEWPEYMIGLANEMASQCQTVLLMPHNYGLTEAHKKCLRKEVKLQTFELVDYKSIRQNFKMISTLLRVLWREKPEILHIQSNGHRLFFWVALFKPFRTKIVNTIHDPEKHTGDLPSQIVDDSLVIYLMRFFTKKYIVHGTFLIEELSRSYKVSKDKIVSIPHGHFEIYKNLQLEHAEEDGFTALFFGRIWPYKGLEYFIKAANLVHQQNSEILFCIAGRGEDFEKYAAMIEHKDKFRIINKRIPIEEVGFLFQKASVVVLPYTDATQSGVIPIAYAYAKPVIASNVGGLPNVVRDGETGFLVSPRSAEQIAEKILYLWSNPSEKKKMSTGAYQFAHEELSWKKIAAVTFSVYSSLQN